MSGDVDYAPRGARSQNRHGDGKRDGQANHQTEGRPAEYRAILAALPTAPPAADRV